MKTLVLNATNQSITAVMSGAAAATNPDVVATYADSTSSAFTEAPQTSALNGTTPVTIVSSPASSTRRIIVGLNVFNRDSAAVTIDINFVDGANTRRLWHGTLQPNEVKTVDGVFDSNGSLKTTVPSLPTTSLTGTLQAAQFPALTGDIVTSAGSLATTLATVNSNVGSFIAPNLTVNAKGLITAADVSTTIPASRLGVMTGDSGSGGAKGAVPAPATGDAIKALFGDGTFKLPGSHPLFARTSLGTGASYTISSIPQNFLVLVLFFAVRSAIASTLDTLRLKLGGASIDTTAARYLQYRHTVNGTTPTHTMVENLGANAFMGLYCTGASAPTDYTSFAKVTIYDYSSASRRKYILIENYVPTSTTTGTQYVEQSGEVWLNTSDALQQIEVSCNGGNLASPSAFAAIGMGSP